MEKYIFVFILSFLSITGLTCLVLFIFEKLKLFQVIEIYPLRAEYFYWILIFGSLKFLKMLLSMPLKVKNISYDLLLSGIGIFYIIHFIFFREKIISTFELFIGLGIGITFVYINKNLNPSKY